MLPISHSFFFECRFLDWFSFAANLQFEWRNMTSPKDSLSDHLQKMESAIERLQKVKIEPLTHVCVPYANTTVLAKFLGANKYLSRRPAQRLQYGAWLLNLRYSMNAESKTQPFLNIFSRNRCRDRSMHPSGMSRLSTGR